MEQNTSEFSSIQGITGGMDDSDFDSRDHRKAKLEVSSSEGSFKFSYISYTEFNAIFKQVKRERQRKREAQSWEKFLERQAANNGGGDVKKPKKQDESTTTINYIVPPLRREPMFFKESKIPQLNQAPVATYLNEGPTCDNLVGPEKEVYTEEATPTLSKVEPNIIKIVHASSDGNDDDTPTNFAQISDVAYQPYIFLKFEGFKKLGKFGRRLDGRQVMRKIDVIQAKIIMALSTIQDVMSKDPFDGVENAAVDMMRNKKRNIAFAARFKRNYHYHLVCQINEIQKLLKLEVTKKTRPSIIKDKLLSAHQVVFQALQIVEKHLIGTYPVDESFSWLREFLESICELASILTAHEGDSEKYDDIKFACEELVETIEDFNDKMADMKMYEKLINKLPPRRIKQAVNQQDNLWMYRNKYACRTPVRSNKNLKA